MRTTITSDYIAIIREVTNFCLMRGLSHTTQIDWEGMIRHNAVIIPDMPPFMYTELQDKLLRSWDLRVFSMYPTQPEEAPV